MEKHQLEQFLRRLRLPGIIDNLELRIREAEENSLSYFEFVSFLVQDELAYREANAFKKNLKAARFGHEKTLMSFDFKFNAAYIDARMIKNLATCRFIDMRESVIIAGPPGMGKTHLAKAIGHEAVKRRYSVLFTKFYPLLRAFQKADVEGTTEKTLKKYVKPALLIIDDFALRTMTAKEAEYFYDLIDQRLGQGSVIITSNRPTIDWLTCFPDPVIGGAILDRVAAGAHKIVATKEAHSYRMARPTSENAIQED